MSGVGMLASSAFGVGNVQHAHAEPAGSAGVDEGGHSGVVKDNMTLTAWFEYVELLAFHHSLDSTNMLDTYCAKRCDEPTLTLRLILLLLLWMLMLVLGGLPVGRH